MRRLAAGVGAARLAVKRDEVREKAAVAAFKQGLAAEDKHLDTLSPQRGSARRHATHKAARPAKKGDAAHTLKAEERSWACRLDVLGLIPKCA